MIVVDSSSAIVRLFNKNVDKYNETKGAYAEWGDSLYLIDGVFFLIQDKGYSWNNIISFRLEESKTPLKETIKKFVEECRRDSIQYIRVNGIKWKNLFLHIKDELRVGVREKDDELLLRLF